MSSEVVSSILVVIANKAYLSPDRTWPSFTCCCCATLCGFTSRLRYVDVHINFRLRLLSPLPQRRQPDAVMPRNRPPKSGYARIAQAEEEQDEDEAYSDHDNPFREPTTLSSSVPSYAPIQPGRHERIQYPENGTVPHRPRRNRTNSGVDIKAINQRLERWAEEIKDRFKIRRVRGKSAEEKHLEIYSSVFQAPDWIRPATKAVLENEYDDSNERLSKLEFDDHVESVRTAIELGMHPTLIAQGSSGSYFARNTGGKVLGVFKPKDEEPYANKNPKWTKWIHRNLLPFAFGRACLIPNLSYVSEAAAYLLDVQLRTNIVPYTEVVSFSSKSFHYDFWERRAFYKKSKPLPEKPGSFQIFLRGFKGATEFFKQHPWPDQQQIGAQSAPPKPKRKRWDESCRPGATLAEDEDSETEESGIAGRERNRRAEFWSDELQHSFREQLEKLVILDYIMRNTDRGTDNWMIRIDQEKQEATIIVEPPREAQYHQTENVGYDRRKENMTTKLPTDNGRAVPRLGAIDNSLSWPWKHPDAWRSYPFGWLFLPVSLIGQPFSEQTRKHFLPLLTSKEWWRDTQVKLRGCFELDADFQEKMYARQIAVMKGQAWNVVETLKTSDHGPLELARRSRVLVWDDVVDIPVANPLSTPSMIRRKTAVTPKTSLPQEISEEDDEMDISAAHAPKAAFDQNLMDISPPSQAARNSFNMSRQHSTQDVLEASRALSPPITTNDKEISDDSPVLMSMRSPRPGHYRSHTGGGIVTKGRISYDSPRAIYTPTKAHRRRFSLNLKTNFGTTGLDEDEDGDLGYAAANDQEGRSRKVIVERLEVVKGKPPVFNWC
nr:phosphatidylinositol 4-kinase lsb6 [Quercus suber]